ncbi:MAG: leucine-rich repeat-containing protein kinase family protein, partial [Arcobacteraceae bacterium]
MQTLEQLNNDELKGIKKLTLCENLSTFPNKIFDLANSLEFLDLSNNKLTTIPNLEKLTHLKIAFFSNNLLTEVPHAFKGCKNLYMLGLKANQIETFDENILPLSISWLILTDNKLKKLPNSIGDLTKLQKFPLAGNQLSSLPETMQNCKNLELIRLSANNLTQMPQWLLNLPKLSWLAFSGNECSIKPEINLEKASLDTLHIQEKLGQGASGMIYKAYCPIREKDVALKLFKGTITSDGYAIDEMNTYMAISKHTNLINVIAKIDEDDKLGLLLDLIPNSYQNLG